MSMKKRELEEEGIWLIDSTSDNAIHVYPTTLPEDGDVEHADFGNEILDMFWTDRHFHGECVYCQTNCCTQRVEIFDRKRRYLIVHNHNTTVRHQMN